MSMDHKTVKDIDDVAAVAACGIGLQAKGQGGSLLGEDSIESKLASVAAKYAISEPFGFAQLWLMGILK